MIKRSIGLGAIFLAAALSGCATTSFSPGLPPTGTVAETLDGALSYTSTFVDWYRARAQTTANGRQGFEIPGFFGTFGGTVATAAGASADAALTGGAITALAGAANAYYAPRTTSAYYRSALSALYCIQQTALGVKPYQTLATTSAQFVAVNGDERATFYLVKNAVLSVEEVLATRLSNAGSVADSAGIAAQYRTLVEERLKKEAQAREQAGAVAQLRSIEATASEVAALSTIMQLQVDLQICVLRAKT